MVLRQKMHKMKHLLLYVLMFIDVKKIFSNSTIQYKIVLLFLNRVFLFKIKHQQRRKVHNGPMIEIGGVVNYPPPPNISSTCYNLYSILHWHWLCNKVCQDKGIKSVVWSPSILAVVHCLRHQQLFLPILLSHQCYR